MAAGPPCVFCDGKQASAVIVTWLSNGTTLTVCVDCFPVAMINVLAVNLGVDPIKFYESVRKLVDRLAKAQDDTAGKGTPDAETESPAPGTGEPTPPDGISTAGHGQSMADIIPDDWSGEAMT